MLSKVRCTAIMAFCSVLAAGATSVLADVPQIEMITVDKQPGPNPALFGGIVTAAFTVHFEDPATGNEIQPPQGTNYLWSCLNVGASEGTAPAPTTDGVTFPGGNDTQTVAVSASYNLTGYAPPPPVDYTMLLQVAVSNDAWKDANENPITLTGTASIDTLFSTVSVTFSPNPVVTGYFQFPLSTPGTFMVIMTPVTAQVSPATETGNITLAIQGQQRVSIDPASINVVPAAGTNTFNVTGNSATPANQPGGDTTIVATDTGILAGTGYAVVAVPSTCTESPFGEVNLENTYKNNGNGGNTFSTLASMLVDINVFDQFGSQLESMYDSTGAVSEAMVLTESPPNNITPLNPFSYPGMVAMPNGALTSGEIEDEAGISSGYDEPAAVVPDPRGWPTFNLAVPVINNVTQNVDFTSNNGILLAMFIRGILWPASDVVNQTLTVAGHVVTPTWNRTMTVNVSPALDVEEGRL